jgi:hypothetical protein
MAKHQFSAFPAGEKHNEDRDQRKTQPERHERARSVAIALIETEQLDEHEDHIADRRVSQRTDAFIAEKID